MPLQGKDGAWFAKIVCHRCEEQAFLQLDLPNSLKFDEHDWTNLEESLLLQLQKEWQDWVYLKKTTPLPAKIRFSATGKTAGCLFDRGLGLSNAFLSDGPLLLIGSRLGEHHCSTAND